jgi:hypothetical protein
VDANQLLTPFSHSRRNYMNYTNLHGKKYSTIHELYVEANITEITKLEKQGWADGQ